MEEDWLVAYSEASPPKLPARPVPEYPPPYATLSGGRVVCVEWPCEEAM